MKSYEDLLELGERDDLKGEFCRKAVQEFQGTEDYKNALDAEAYYKKRNKTIEQYKKWLYTVTGRQIEDIYSPNYKLKTHFFRRGVIQKTQYILGNGIKLKNENNKKKLGKDFESKVQRALKMAFVGGKAFGFYNYDHIEVFGYACTSRHAGFCPLYSKETTELTAGIRFRVEKVGNDTITLYTLYEPEGITEFRKKGSDDIELIQTRRAYKTVSVATKAEGLIATEAEGYGELPIAPLYANDLYESELVGNRESIDCYDLIKSGLANNIDEASEIYWIVKNAGGMDDPDLAKFLYRLKTTHAAEVDSIEGGDVESHEVNVPTEARAKLLEMLRSDIYEDMMLVDMKTLSAAQKTTQEIKAAYQAMDASADDTEYFLLDFLDKIFRLAGIPDEEATFTRSKVVNETETTNMVLSAGNYVSNECIIKHLPWLTPEEQLEEIKTLDERMMEQFKQPVEEDDDEESGERDDRSGAPEAGEED